MKRTLAILLIAVLAAGSVFAAFSGEASLGFGGNLDNGNYGFIDSGAKVSVDVDLATADAEAIAEGDVYAGIKATFGLKLYTGEEKVAETDGDYPGRDTQWGVGFMSDIEEAYVAGQNWKVSILGLNDAPNYAKGFQTYTVEDGMDKWGFSRADFDENYNTELPFKKATGVQVTVYDYDFGVGLIGDYADENTWKFDENISVAALFETPEYDINGLTFQLGTVYSYQTIEKFNSGAPEYAASKTNAWNVSGKVGFANDTLSASAATDVSLNFAGKDVSFDADVVANFVYDFVSVDAYYGTNPVVGKKPTGEPDTYKKTRSEDMLSAQVGIDLNSFNVPVDLTIGVNDIIATQEIKASADLTFVEGLKLTIKGGYTIDADGRIGTDATTTADGQKTIAKDDGRKYVGKWSAGADVEYDMDIMKITAGVSAEQRIEDGAKVKLGANAAVETSSLIPGATLKFAWADADDLLDMSADDTNYGKITASCKITF